MLPQRSNGMGFILYLHKCRSGPDYITQDRYMTYYNIAIRSDGSIRDGINIAISYTKVVNHDINRLRPLKNTNETSSL